MQNGAPGEDAAARGSDETLRVVRRSGDTEGVPEGDAEPAAALLPEFVPPGHRIWLLHRLKRSLHDSLGAPLTVALPS